ncbi:RNA polymerase sigma factor [Metabacillus endolithicus]|uniref:RNA polymerase sigma factor n=1 Tax=Metabacillus endolithicus TaxID=1535204 RepID=UPI001FF70BBB|nr:RNA polymerase sigma factor [Metabacillus endolithicus]UPG66042.1 RNA polymerase sigma factor [Metabacillus endolithicus]
MTISRDQQLSIYDKSRELKKEFNQLVDEFTEGLWRYCLYLTGSHWDGEDLYQETMVKALGNIYQRWHPTNPKPYLYRIATNTWIDHCRKEKRIIGSLEEEEVPAEENPDTLDVEEALNHLISLFTPRQCAVFLLMEVFSFTAKEVAGIVQTTPGAVYATLQRMRTKLKNQPPKSNSKPDSTLNSIKSEDTTIKKYLNALNNGDLEGVLSIFSDNAHNEASLGFQEFTKDEMRSGSMQFGLPGFVLKGTNFGGEMSLLYFMMENKVQKFTIFSIKKLKMGKLFFIVVIILGRNSCLLPLKS